MAQLVATGAGDKEIARALHVTPRTVKNTVSTIYRVLHLPADHNRRVLLARLVIEQGQGGEG